MIEEKNKYKWIKVFNEQHPTLEDKRMAVERRIRDQVNNLGELLTNFCHSSNDKLLNAEDLAIISKKLDNMNNDIWDLDYFVINSGIYDLGELWEKEDE